MALIVAQMSPPPRRLVPRRETCSCPEVVLEQLEVIQKSELVPEAGDAKPWRVAATTPATRPNPREPPGTGEMQAPWLKFKLSG